MTPEESVQALNTLFNDVAQRTAGVAKNAFRILHHSLLNYVTYTAPAIGELERLEKEAELHPEREAELEIQAAAFHPDHRVGIGYVHGAFKAVAFASNRDPKAKIIFDEIKPKITEATNGMVYFLKQADNTDNNDDTPDSPPPADEPRLDNPGLGSGKFSF